MARQFQPRRLDVQAFAEDGARLEGDAPLTDFPRLAGEAIDPAGRTVHWRATGELLNPQHVQPQVWVRLQADAVLPMTCQRCLEPVEMALKVDRSFRFVADEATAAAEDDESEEDLLVVSRAFDLPGLVEDELLMEVPVVPRHEVCPAPVQLSAADADFDEAAEKPNPFAALDALRRNVKG